MTTPPSPCGTLSEVSRTSRAFSLKIARMSFSSAVSSVSPLGVTLPTSRSPERTSAPTRTMPSSSRLASDSLAAVRDVAGDLLITELGGSCVDFVLVNVDGREHVVLHDALVEDDRVLEVVALPAHERDRAGSCRARSRRVSVERAVGEDLTGVDLLAELHDRASGG